MDGWKPIGGTDPDAEGKELLDSTKPLSSGGKEPDAEGKELLASTKPLSSGTDMEILDLELQHAVGPDTFDNKGISGIYYGDYVVDLEEINFYLYTSSEFKRAQLLQFTNPIGLKRTHWDPDRPTKFYIHGFMQSGVDMITDLINAYFDGKQNSPDTPNLIIVDWGKYSHTLEYFYMARFIVPLVGVAVGKMIQTLLNHEVDGTKKNTTPDLIHIIGHSLGGQIASNAAKYLDVKVARITALDPAQPYFEGLFAQPHITKEDADFVDIIHSNMQICGYGMYTKCGHVDFYPNGGAWQEGCFLIDMLSNHERSVRYFIESINSTKKFYAQRAESWQKYKKGILQSEHFLEMGDHLIPSSNIVEGNYYLRTNAFAPYAKGEDS